MEPATGSGKPSSRSGDGGHRLNAIVQLVWVVLPIVHLCFVLTGCYLTVYKNVKGRTPGGPVNSVWKWTKWPAFVNLFCQPVLDIMFIGDNMHWWSGLIWAANAYNWWMFRNAGDDDWSKKMKARLTETVERVGGKLVIVPAVAR